MARYRLYSKGWGVALALIFTVAAMAPICSGVAEAEDFESRLSEASGNLSISTLKIHLGAEGGIITDDNIYNLSKEEKRDVITYLQPGLSLGLDTDNAVFRGGYSATAYQYRDYTNEDYVAHRAYFSYNYASDSGVYIGVSDSFEYSKEPRSEENTLRAQHTMHNLDGTLGYDFPGRKLSIEGAVTRMLLDYDEDHAYLSRTDDDYRARLYLRFLPKTAFFVQYDYERTDYNDNFSDLLDADSYSNTWSGGVKWDATATLMGELRGGYTDKIHTYGPHKSNGQDTWIMSADLTYNWSDQTKIFLKGSRGFLETSFDGDTLHSASNTYQETSGELGYMTRFFNRLDFYLAGGLARDKFVIYEQTKDARRDHIRYWNSSLTYNFNTYVSAGLSYDQRHTKSNVDTSTVERHIYKFFIAVML